MATEFNVSIPAHPSVYEPTPEERQVDILFTVPEKGVSENTGLLLFATGYGENLETPHLKEVREYIAEHHDLVVIQSSYFGNQYMQDSSNAQYTINIEALKSIFTEEHVNYVFDGIAIDYNRLVEVGGSYSFLLKGREGMDETLSSFNDMGLMQALDQISAVYAVRAILSDNGYQINNQRIYAYGQGHGAYLCYLCNAMAPNLFSCIVDNSSWLFPPYLRARRIVNASYGLMSFSVAFEYLANQMEYDYEFLHLSHLYKQFRNKARIISFHGKEDSFLNLQHKKSFCDSVKNCTLSEIKEQMLDGNVFKSMNHGLGTDYCSLFDYAINQSTILGLLSDPFSGVTHLETKTNVYRIDLSGEMPILGKTIKETANNLR